MLLCLHLLHGTGLFCSCSSLCSLLSLLSLCRFTTPLHSCPPSTLPPSLIFSTLPLLPTSYTSLPPMPCSCAKLDYGTAQRIIDDRVSLGMAAEDDIAAGRAVHPSAALATAMEDGDGSESTSAATASVDTDTAGSSSAAGSEGAVSARGIPADLWDPKRRPPITRKAGADASAAAVYDAEGAGLPQQTCVGIVRDVRMMHAIAMARRRKRFAAGALALHRGKLTLALDPAGNPVGVATYPIYDSNRMIEEFMLL